MLRDRSPERQADDRAEQELGRSDWLSECRGFRVELERGRVGVVDHVRRDPDSGRPAQLAISAGRIRRRFLLVPVEDVDGVLPAGRRLLLRHGWAPCAECRVSLLDRALAHGLGSGSSRSSIDVLACPVGGRLAKGGEADAAPGEEAEPVGDADGSRFAGWVGLAY